MAYAMKCYEGSDPRIEVTDEFIERNRLEISEKAVLDVLRNRDDVFGFTYEVALPFLDVSKLTLQEMKEIFHEMPEDFSPICDVKEATQDFLDYMVFAWMKAEDQRGISAGRSIAKLSTWMKILSRPDVADVLNDDTLYNPYGMPALLKACSMLGIEYPERLVKFAGRPVDEDED